MTERDSDEIFMRTEKKLGDTAKVALHLTNLAGGGAERQTIQLANNLSLAGHQVSLVLAKKIGRYLFEISPKVEIVELFGKGKGLTIQSENGVSKNEHSNASTNYPRVHRFITNWLIRLTLARYLRKERPEVLVSGMNFPNINAFIASKASLIDVRFIATQHNNFSTQNGGPGLSRFFHRLTLTWALRGSDAVVAVSDGVAQDLLRSAQIPVSKLRVIHNPVTNDSILTRAQEPVDPVLKTTSKVPYFIFVGRLKPVKRVDDILRAFDGVSRRVDSNLLILGEGAQKTELQNLANDLGLGDKVKFLGFVENPYPFIRDSSCMVLASEYEGFPSVLIEALYLKTQVISADCDYGPREIQKSIGSLRLFPVGDVHTMEKLMLEALNQPEDQNTKRRASDAVETLYGPEANASNWADLMKSII